MMGRNTKGDDYYVDDGEKPENDGTFFSSLHSSELDFCPECEGPLLLKSRGYRCQSCKKYIYLHEDV